MSHDTKGNVAVQGAFLGGVTTNVNPCISIGQYKMITNAPSIENLNGLGYQVGGSVGVPIPETPIAATAGREINIIPDPEANTNYFGLTTSEGIGTAGIIGTEFHVDWGKTATWELTQVNFFKCAEIIYANIMEW